MTDNPLSDIPEGALNAVFAARVPPHPEPGLLAFLYWCQANLEGQRFLARVLFTGQERADLRTATAAPFSPELSSAREKLDA